MSCFQSDEEGHARNRVMIEDGALKNRARRSASSRYTSTRDSMSARSVSAMGCFCQRRQVRNHDREQGRTRPDAAHDARSRRRGYVRHHDVADDRELRDRAEGPRRVRGRRVRRRSTFNVISYRAALLGTVRCFDPEIRKSMPERMERIVAGVASAMNVVYDLDYR